MLIEDVHRERPAQHLEAGHFRPGAVGDKQRVGADVERRFGAEFAAPQSDGAYVAKLFIQHMGDHAQRIGKVAVCDFVFEIANNDGAEIIAHDVDCLAPIKRKSPE